MRVAQSRSNVVIELGGLRVTLPHAKAKQLARHIACALNPEESA